MRLTTILATFVAIILGQGASAQTRDRLTGYDRFEFGTSESRLRQVVQMDQGKPEDGGTRYKAIAPTDIYGADYVTSFLFKEGRLMRINLLNSSSLSEPACRSRFLRVVALLREKYGPPDQAPENNMFGSLASPRSARFSFRDGSDIRSAGVWQNDGCTASVVYTAAKGGGPF